MSGPLLWDGLRLEAPEGFEAVVLDRGFLRLSGPDGAKVDVRFGPAGGTFDPAGDGRRILRAAGLADTRLEPCREEWTAASRARAFHSGRLCVLHFPERRGIAAVLFSAPGMKSPELLASIGWTPPDSWRSWRCFDLAFETPPGTLLDSARFQPGAFHFRFRCGRTAMFLDRLAPADVLLAETTFEAWARLFVRRRLGREAVFTPDGDERIAFREAPTPLQRLLPFLPAHGTVGRAWRQPARNRILVLGASGRPFPRDVSERIERAFTAHAAPPHQS